MTNNSTLNDQSTGAAGADYITLIRTHAPCNKTIEIDSEGNISKRPANQITDGILETRHIPDVRAMEALLQEISDTTNVTLVLGYVPADP